MKTNVTFRVCSPLIAGAALLLVAGCGGGNGGPRFRDSQSGVTMTLPAGWRQSGNMCFENRDGGDWSGMVTVMPMEGEDLESHAERVLKAQVAMSDAFKGLVGIAGDLASGEATEEVEKAQENLDTTFTTPKALQVGGVDAFEAVITTPTLTSIRVFIMKDSSVVEVVFRAETDRWSEYESLFRTSIESIRVK